MERKIKLTFDLKGTGWKAPEETVWAEKIGENKYRLLNSPFYAPGFSFEDIVSAEEKDGKQGQSPLISEIYGII